MIKNWEHIGNSFYIKISTNLEDTFLGISMRYTTSDIFQTFQCGLENTFIHKKNYTNIFLDRHIIFSI